MQLLWELTKCKPICLSNLYNNIIKELAHSNERRPVTLSPMGRILMGSSQAVEVQMHLVKRKNQEAVPVKANLIKLSNPKGL